MQIDIATIFNPIESEMTQLNAYFLQQLHHRSLQIDNLLSYVSSHKGKRLRPAMVFLSAAINGQINHQTHAAARVLELLHFSSLIHDDIVDNGQKRHNKPTVNAQWNNRVAVLLGDYLLSESVHLIAQSGSQRLLNIVAHTTKAMVSGELLQLAYLQEHILSKEQYMAVIQQKTASLIAACFEMGAASAGADEATVQQWRDFGMETGIIFQIKDDLFDYQKNDVLGKDAYKDIQEHKISLPFIFALEQTPADKRQEWFQRYKNHSGTEEEIQAIIDMVIENRGIALTEQFLEDKFQQIRQFIDKQPDSIYKQSLLSLICYVKDRRY
jgi:octaprenyl-diphosphate synthase